jgi:hypothetical protein
VSKGLTYGDSLVCPFTLWWLKALPITFPRLAQWGILENKIVNQHEFTIEAQSFNEPL